MPRTTITLDRRVILEMENHASSTYPEECCRLLLGRFEEGSTGKLVKSSIRLENVFEAKRRYHRYTIDPMKYMIVENEAAAMNEEIVGIYHSHHGGEARPSLIDLNYACPLLSYAVLGVRDFEPVDTKSWIRKEDRTGFLPEFIAVQGEE